MDSPHSGASAERTSDRTVSVNFVCQRCCQPLKLHSSFTELNEQTFNELTTPLYPYSRSNCSPNFIEEFQKSIDNSDDGVSRKLILPVNLSETGSGFMIVTDGVKEDLRSGNQASLRVTATLFDILSDQSDIDHPLCEECTDNLLDQMDQQLRIAEEESKQYQEYLEQLDAKHEEEDIEKLEKELEDMQNEEKKLQKQLRDTEIKENEAKAKLKVLQEEHEKLQREEDRYWQEYTLLKKQAMMCEEEQCSVDNQLRYAQTHLDKLKKTNIFNATFHIWHNGHFGTINNFRLGRLPSVPVEWPEINAAWGQTVLLLHSLAKKMDLTFQRYRLVPYGNHSYLESLDDKAKELPLHCSGGFRYLWDTKFDQAMVAFLDCLQQFKEQVSKIDLAFHLPYKMEAGKIQDTNTGNIYSVKIQFNSEEQWTKALKFMLTNLKWALAWVSSQFTDDATGACGTTESEKVTT